MIDESIKTKVLSNVNSKQATISKNTGAIFSILTESVYSDVMSAGIREIISNAIDSTKRAKNNKPIQITPPTKFAQTFMVRDFGLGLSHQEIYDLYTSVGESSKKQSEDEVGFFGIGAMSPFAYVESFTVVSYQNGKARTYSIYMGESGVPEIAFIREINTDQPDGFEVSYSVKITDCATFNAKLYQILSYIDKSAWEWSDKKFAQNIVYYKDTIKSSSNFVLDIDDKYFISNRAYSYYGGNNNTGNTLVMGGVAYEYDSTVTGSKLFTSHSLVIEAPIGAVSVQASREKLKMNTKTISYLKTAVMEVDSKIKETIEKNIAGIDNLKDAMRFCEKITYGRHLIPNWKGFSTTESNFNTILKASFAIEGLNGKKFHKDRYTNTRISKIILNDIGHGGKSRVINDPKYQNCSVTLLTPLLENTDIEEFKKKYGNIFDAKTSELEKPEKLTAQKKRKDKVYIFNSAGGYTFNSMVTESDKEYDDYKDYYIITKNKSVVIDDKLVNLRVLFDIKEYVDNKIIILDHEADIPKNARCLVKYLKDTVLEEMKKCVNAEMVYAFTYNYPYSFRLYNFLYKNRKDLKECIDKIPTKSKISSIHPYNAILHYLGLSFDDVKIDIQDQVNKIVSKYYPILEMVAGKPTDQQMSALIKYVSEGDQNVFSLHVN